MKDRPFHTAGSQPNIPPHQSSQKLGQASPITSELPISFLVPHSYTEDQINMLRASEGNKLQTAENQPTNRSVSSEISENICVLEMTAEIETQQKY